MNILFIENAGHTSAGAFHALVVLADKLKEYGVNSFVALPDRADGCHLLDEKGIKYITLRACSYTQMIPMDVSVIEKIKMPFKDMAVRMAADKLVKYVQDNHIDIIHENTSACYIGKYVAEKAHVKHIWHIREMMEEGYGCQLWNRDQAIKDFNKADKVIAISKAVYNKYSDDIDNKKLCIIYDGVNVEKYLNKDRQILDAPVINVLVAGRVTDTKGQHIVVSAIGKLWQQYGIHMRLRVAGLCDDEQRNKLENIAREYEVLDHIDIIGQCESMKDEYDRADILVSAALHEGFGLVTVEAMLSGCLVIGADSGATTEILGEGSGLLVKASDEDDLTEKLKYVYDNRQLCQDMAAKGQEKAASDFTAEKNARQIMDVYKDITGK